MSNHTKLVAYLNRRVRKSRPPQAKPILMPFAVEQRYAQDLRAHVLIMGKRDLDIVMRNYAQVLDAPNEKWRKIKRLLKSEVETETDLMLPFVRNANDAINISNATQVMAQLSAINIIPVTAKLAKQAQSFQLGSLKYIKKTRRKLIAEYIDLAAEHFQQGAASGDLSTKLMDRLKIASNHAAMIAGDQAGTYFGALTRARHEAAGIEEYTWITSRDDAVRPDHEERDGTVFRYDSPPVDGNPGEPINCRCTGSPVLP